jgi:hypothetical protein
MKNRCKEYARTDAREPVLISDNRGRHRPFTYLYLPVCAVI